jgi:hypothetical protein
MRVVELRVGRSTFGEVLAEMRQWIDRNGGDPVKFDSESASGGNIRIRLEFSRDEVAVAFRRDWSQAALEETALAA